MFSLWFQPNGGLKMSRSRAVRFEWDDKTNGWVEKRGCRHHKRRYMNSCPADEKPSRTRKNRSEMSKKKNDRN